MDQAICVGGAAATPMVMAADATAMGATARAGLATAKVGIVAARSTVKTAARVAGEGFSEVATNVGRSEVTAAVASASAAADASTDAAVRATLTPGRIATAAGGAPVGASDGGDVARNFAFGLLPGSTGVQFGMMAAGACNRAFGG